MGLEGIVSKRKDSAYRSGRSPDWLKMKNPACAAVTREAEEDWARWLVASASPFLFQGRRGAGPEGLAGAGPSAAPIIEGDCGLLESRSGELKIQLKLCCPWDIHEGLFRKQLGIDLTYERTTVFECGLSLDFLEHDCTPIQQGSRWDLPQLQGRLTLQLSKNQFPVLLEYAKASFERINTSRPVPPWRDDA
jgi:hypothetical protein